MDNQDVVKETQSQDTSEQEKIANKVNRLRNTQSVLNKLIENEINDILGEEYSIAQYVYKKVEDHDDQSD